MMYFFNLGWGMPWHSAPWFPVLLIILVLWSLFWKGLALWHSAKRRQPLWFVVILLVNTVGILELIYLFAIAKVQSRELFKK
jgi:hypothetical protein